MVERKTLGFLLRGRWPSDRVATLVAKALGVPADGVAAVLDQEADQPHPVLLKLVARERGFQSDVTVFVDQALAKGLDSLVLAQGVASAGAIDVLVAPQVSMPLAAIPYAWILITAGGERFVVTESDPDSGSVVVDDGPQARRPL